MTRLTHTPFIVFEGIDGAGTTTQSRLLEERLVAEEIPTKLTREPSDGPIGTMIRQMLSMRMVLPDGRPITRETLALLFAADRMDHVAAEVQPLLEQGITVVSDRYYHSSLAYQGDVERDDKGQESVDYAWVRALNERARAPDLTFFLRVDADTALERLRSRTQRDLYETREKLERLVQRYEEVMEMLQDDGQRIIILNGSEPLDHIHQTIWKVASNWYAAFRDQGSP